MVFTFHLPSNLFAAYPPPGPQINWKAGGGFAFVWLRRRRQPRDTVQIVFFAGGPLLETIFCRGKKQEMKGIFSSPI